MKNKIFVVFLIVVIALVCCNIAVSSRQIQNNQTIHPSNSDSYVTIWGNVRGIIFDIEQAHVIIEGVDNDFYKETTECSIPFESPFEFYVPEPEDAQDHYRVTGEKEGYKTNTIDVFVKPGDDYIWIEVILTRDFSTKTRMPLFIQNLLARLL